MRVRYSFSSRRTGHLTNITREKEKFPAILEKVIYLSDVVLEILDARFIQETRNLKVEEEIKKRKKKLIYVLNKSDLIDISKKKAELPLDLVPYVFVSALEREGTKELRNLIKIEAKRIENDSEKNPGKRQIRKLTKRNKYPRKKYNETEDDEDEKEENIDKKIKVGVIGYPNTGKSSVINILIGRSSTRTGTEAGWTKGIQKLKLTPQIQLLDSPGVIPKKEYSSINKEAISKHAKVGARDYHKVKDPEIVIASLMTEYPGIFEKFYSIEANGNSEVLIEEIGKKKRLLVKGGEIDTDRAARVILRDWQEGKIRV